MTGNSFFAQFKSKSAFILGFLLGVCVLVGVSATTLPVISVEIGGGLLWFGKLVDVPLMESLGAKPQYALRLIQAIGILLPLFTGLLRFTTDDQSEVSVRINDYLVIGILGLVLGGVLAAIGGVAADTAIILKASLIAVVFTFTLIGLAAMVMLREMTARVEESSEIASRGDENGEPEMDAEREADSEAADDRVEDEKTGVADGSEKESTDDSPQQRNKCETASETDLDGDESDGNEN